MRRDRYAVVFCLSLFFIPTSCRIHQAPGSDTKEFQVAQDHDEGNLVAHPLPLASAIAGVHPQVKRIALRPLAEAGGYGNEEQYRYQISFGSLSQAQFDQLKTAYGGKSEQLYDPNRKYELQDFLQPQIQALIGHRFVSQAINDIRELVLINEAYTSASGENPENSKTQNTSSISSNCWGTVWELIRGDKSQITLFYAPNYIVDHYMSRSEYSDEIADDGRFWEADDVMIGAVPGDVLLIKARWGNKFSAEPLMHAAIKIDDGWYFEKTGTDSGFSYRFVHISDLIKVYAKEQSLYTLRRFKQALPDPAGTLKMTNNEQARSYLESRLADGSKVETIFGKFIAGVEPVGMGSHMMVSIAHLQKVPLVKDEWNRYSLHQDAYKPETFLISSELGEEDVLPIKSGYQPRVEECRQNSNYRTCSDETDQRGMRKVCSNPADFALDVPVYMYCQECQADKARPCGPSPAVGGFFNDCAKGCENPLRPEEKADFSTCADGQGDCL